LERVLIMMSPWSEGIRFFFLLRFMFSPSYTYNVSCSQDLARCFLSQNVSADDNDLASDEGSDRGCGSRGDRLGTHRASMATIGAARETASDAVALAATIGTGVGAIHPPEPNVSGSEAAGAVSRADHFLSLPL
jgi:hypothetical protein